VEDFRSKSKYNNQPTVEINNIPFSVENGWVSICQRLNREISSIPGSRKIIVIETHQGVIHEELSEELRGGLIDNSFIYAEDAMLSEELIKDMVQPGLTDDRIFGFMSRLTMDAFFDPEKVAAVQADINGKKEGVIVIYGSGAAIICPDPDLLVYADMARWEIQLRMRKHLVNNLGLKNRDTEDWMLLYKQGYFLDWRVCEPKMVEGKAVLKAIE